MRHRGKFQVSAPRRLIRLARDVALELRPGAGPTDPPCPSDMKSVISFLQWFMRVTQRLHCITAAFGIFVSFTLNDTSGPSVVP
ncbi:unnamed protein product [Heligmosomoides polygyrus]|uniref:Uncharacterized protein n=1 Tax=Heligmosomoides polygyrus TaxID=6339 RepID=A0A183GE54_HELPZ|nr:unnamed protein product [Heligmosomoides polygyrus]